MFGTRIVEIYIYIYFHTACFDRFFRCYTSHKNSGNTTNPAGHESGNSGEVIWEILNKIYDYNHHISHQSPTADHQMNELQVQVQPPEHRRNPTEPQNPTGSHPEPQNRTTNTATPYAVTVISHEDPNAGDTAADGVYREVIAGSEVHVYDVPQW